MKAPGFEEKGFTAHDTETPPKETAVRDQQRDQVGARNFQTSAREARFGETSPSMRDAQTAYEAFIHKGGKPWAELEAEERAAWARAAAAISKNASPASPDVAPKGRVSDTGEPTPEERRKLQDEKMRASQQRAEERFRERAPGEDARHWERTGQAQYSPDYRGSQQGPHVGPPMPADPSLMHTPLSPPGSLSHPQGQHLPSQAVSPMTPPAMPHGQESYGNDPSDTRAPSVQVPTNTPKKSR